MASTAGRKGTDGESVAIIYEGATIRQLAMMFKSDPKVVARKVSGLVPVASRDGTVVYSIPEAAARLVKPSYDIERYIMEMNHLDLPPLLSKEFWNSQIARAKFEEMNADLWRTPEVVRAISELFNDTRMVLNLLPDTIEREAGLSREQKAVVRRTVDGAIVAGRDKLVKRFEKYAERLGVQYDNSGGSERLPVPVIDRAESPYSGGAGVPETSPDEDEYNGL